MSEDRVDEVWNIDSKARKEFLFQRIIDLLSVFGGVFEAARVEGPRCLLKRRCKRGARWWRCCWLWYWSCGMGYLGSRAYDVENSVPDIKIRCIFDDKS